MNLTILEERLLRAVGNLRSNAYGVPIREAVKEATGFAPSLNGLYEGLERLERIGMLKSWMGEKTPERGGKPKKHYALTGEGERVLAARDAERIPMTGLEGAL